MGVVRGDVVVRRTCRLENSSTPYITGGECALSAMCVGKRRRPTTPVQVAHRPIPQDGPKPGINVPDDTHGNGGNLGGNTLRAHVEFEVEGSFGVGSTVVRLFVIFVSPSPVPSVSKTNGWLDGSEVEQWTDCSEGGVERLSNTSSDVETPGGARATMPGGASLPVGCGGGGGCVPAPPTCATSTSV